MLPPGQLPHAVLCGRVQHWHVVTLLHGFTAGIKQDVDMPVYCLLLVSVRPSHIHLIDTHVRLQTLPHRGVTVSPVYDEGLGQNIKCIPSGIEVQYVHNLVLAIATVTHIMPWNAMSVHNEPGLIPGMHALQSVCRACLPPQLIVCASVPILVEPGIKDAGLLLLDCIPELCLGASDQQVGCTSSLLHVIIRVVQVVDGLKGRQDEHVSPTASLNECLLRCWPRHPPLQPPADQEVGVNQGKQLRAGLKPGEVAQCVDGVQSHGALLCVDLIHQQQVKLAGMWISLHLFCKCCCLLDGPSQE
mmetsp:Transcript_38290/g.85266  ORF Transcript_38290/g.85266 Transcript_38290/m.85266 type:complete len:302 (-) Transcript_38290:914-1819(-)